MELVGPAHGANQTNVVVLSIFGNGELGRDGVDGVDDVVELAVCLLQNAREEIIDVVAQQVFGTVAAGLISRIMVSITSTLRLPMVL